jgi:hypothetical protein
LQSLLKPTPAIQIIGQHAICSQIGLGKVTAAFIRGHVDLQIREYARLYCESPVWMARVHLTEVRHCQVQDLTVQDLNDSGYKNRAEIRKAVFGEFSPSWPRHVTVVRWNNASGLFIKNAAEFAADPESVYENLSCE